MFDSIGKVEMSELQAVFNEAGEQRQCLPVFTPNLWELVSRACFEDDAKTLEKVLFVIKLLCEEAKKLYALMIVPEIDVAQMKDLVEGAIKQFRGQINGCDAAFAKLLGSLDVFIQKFDKYYEKFLVEGKDPMVFFFEFIEDVKAQYEGIDKKGCREILRQFKGIQQEFGKRMAKNMSDPYVRDLYDMLCEQMDRAGKIIEMDD